MASAVGESNRRVSHRHLSGHCFGKSLPRTREAPSDVETLEPDIFEIEPSDRDRFVLCSDGLTDLVSDDEIFEMTQKNKDPSNLCRKLVDTVLKRGAHDNATIVSVFLSGIKTGRGGPISKMGSLFAEFVTGIRKVIRI